MSPSDDQNLTIVDSTDYTEGAGGVGETVAEDALRGSFDAHGNYVQTHGLFHPLFYVVMVLSPFYGNAVPLVLIEQTERGRELVAQRIFSNAAGIAIVVDTIILPFLLIPLTWIPLYLFKFWLAQRIWEVVEESRRPTATA